MGTPLAQAYRPLFVMNKGWETNSELQEEASAPKGGLHDVAAEQHLDPGRTPLHHTERLPFQDAVAGPHRKLQGRGRGSAVRGWFLNLS